MNTLVGSKIDINYYLKVYECMRMCIVSHLHLVNFAQNELGQMAVDVVLEPGDLLYFPRGYTHQVIIVVYMY